MSHLKIAKKKNLKTSLKRLKSSSCQDLVTRIHFREQNEKQKEEENINYKLRKVDEEIVILKSKLEEVKSDFLSLNPRDDQKKRVEASYQKQKQKINDNIQKLERRKQKLGECLKFSNIGQILDFGII